MSSPTCAGNPDSSSTGFRPGPPPPPPPPPGSAQVPVLRINTTEPPAAKRPQNNVDSLEPPAAIQNAMMTKDKKPFTYTPGMGGKLDLSQIRSPRMARRVAKNANDEGIEGPPKSILEQKVTTPPTTANLFVQPQVAVPVFPTNVPSQPSLNRTPSSRDGNRVPSIGATTVPDRQTEPPTRTPVKVETKIIPVTTTSSQPTSPQTPDTPPQVTLVKAPTPWLQNKNKPAEELPEWAKRANAPRQQNSSSPESPASPPVYQQVQQSPPVRQTQQQPMLVQQMQQSMRQQTKPQTQRQQRQQQQDRVIPVRIEDRPSVFSAKHEPDHHQLKQPSQQHQQRWGPNSQQNQVQPQSQTQPQQTGGARIIPIMVEDTGVKSSVVPAYSQPQNRNVPIENQASKVKVQRNPTPIQQQEPGPIQSRAFRVLQKITDTDADSDVDLGAEQVRKLQLTEDDKTLMNKFKEQVDGDTYLHQEEDPRYRGAAIPSRAFRFLQNMTDTGDSSATSTAPRTPVGVTNKKPNRNTKTPDEAQLNLPPSEQQVQEPKKYMGSAIPSRSFRILQAMTAPENVATQENRQPDFISQTENSMPGNQQGVFFPGCPPPFWNPDGGWWGYYPMQYAPNTNSHNVPYDPYAYYYGYGDGSAYAYYPIYDQSYAQIYGQSNSSNRTRLDYSEGNYGRAYPQCVLPDQVLNCDQNCNRHYEQNGYEARCNSICPSTDGKKEMTEQGTNHNPNLLAVPKWNVSRSSSNSSKDSDDTTAMNITDEEESVPEVTIIAVKDRKVEMLEEDRNPDVSEVTAKPNDTGDDDTSDSESSDADSDVESALESSKSSSSSSSDSDSESEYLAYSTGLNPREKVLKETDNSKLNLDKDSRQSLSGTTISEDTYEQSSRLSSDKLSFSDSDSDADDEYQIESLNNDSVLPHQLSVIYEDIEQLDHVDNKGHEDPKDTRQDNKNNVILGETDDPPDDVDSATVSVSLPLRFKFSVSENNEEVTTVIVGDSLIKAEKGASKEDEPSQSRGIDDEDNDVHVDFKIGRSNETFVDFTLKKQKPREVTSAELTLKNDEKRVKSRRSNTENVDVELSGVEKSTNCEFTLRGDKERVRNVDCDQNVETEFTVRTKKTDVMTHTWKKNLNLKQECDVEDRISNKTLKNDTKTECTMRSMTRNGIEENRNEENTVVNSKIELNDDVCKEITESRSLKIKEKESVQTEFTVKKLDTVLRSSEIENTNVSNKSENCGTRNTVPKNTNDETVKESDVGSTLMFDKVRNDLNDRSKHLLSVQNSRDETDDEDSGVTSDMSRLISEVDTDSECTLSSKKMSKYQRTQTHSRLFKLLNDDSILTEDSSENPVSPVGRECLSLPLKNVFSYDETYHSNYSSGLTSPEYSPVYEQSWKRLHESENIGNGVTTTSNELASFNGHLGLRTMTNQEKPNQDDPYFQTWKIPRPPSEFDHDVLPSLTLKKLENRLPYKAHRIHVLCPRIKSSKNVPQVLQSAPGKPIAPSTLPSISYVKNDHC